MRGLKQPGGCLFDSLAKEKFMPTDTQHEVVVTDIRMPFWSMVVLMVKLALASIPAGIILAVIYLIFATILRGLRGPFSF